MKEIRELARSAADAVACWRQRAGGAEVLFLGRGCAGDRETALARVEPTRPAAAWLRQVHSAEVVEGRRGASGEGDALWTRGPGLALSVATADCVPVVLTGERVVAAVHAGWRGIVAGVIPATLRALRAVSGDHRALVAWVGPAIGPCCYEVGDEVAAAVADASGPEVRSPGPRGRPHLDLHRAVARQLDAAGISIGGRVVECTRCSSDLLWSYRRDGERAERNLAFVWLRPPAEGSTS